MKRTASLILCLLGVNLAWADHDGRKDERLSGGGYAPVCKTNPEIPGIFLNEGKKIQDALKAEKLQTTSIGKGIVKVNSTTGFNARTFVFDLEACDPITRKCVKQGELIMEEDIIEGIVHPVRKYRVRANSLMP